MLPADRVLFKEILTTTPSRGTIAREGYEAGSWDIIRR
jgi:hypothetical protein